MLPPPSRNMVGVVLAMKVSVRYLGAGLGWSERHQRRADGAHHVR